MPTIESGLQTLGKMRTAKQILKGSRSLELFKSAIAEHLGKA